MDHNPPACACGCPSHHPDSRQLSQKASCGLAQKADHRRPWPLPTKTAHPAKPGPGITAQRLATAKRHRQPVAEQTTKTGDNSIITTTPPYRV